MAVIGSSSKTSCKYCKSSKDLEECDSFGKLSTHEKHNFIMQLGFCSDVSCVAIPLPSCSQKKTCEVCKGRHPTLHGCDTKRREEVVSSPKVRKIFPISHLCYSKSVTLTEIEQRASYQQRAGQDLVPHLFKIIQRCFLHSLKVWYSARAVLMHRFLHSDMQCCMYGETNRREEVVSLHSNLQDGSRCFLQDLQVKTRSWQTIT